MTSPRPHSPTPQAPIPRGMSGARLPRAPSTRMPNIPGAKLVPSTPDKATRVARKKERRKKEAAKAAKEVTEERMQKMVALVRAKVLQLYRTVQEAFEKLDRDGTGLISRKEFKLFLKTYNVRIQAPEVCLRVEAGPFLVPRLPYPRGGGGMRAFFEMVGASF